MARIGRLAGAILISTEGRYFLVGNPKQPCDFVAEGFEDPGVVDAIAAPVRELSPRRAVEVEGFAFDVELEGEAVARIVADRMLITRNASVSERLWMLAADVDPEDDLPESPVAGRWLVEMPDRVWAVVRETVLRCV